MLLYSLVAEKITQADRRLNNSASIQFQPDLALLRDGWLKAAFRA